ncbi:MAG: type IV secretion system DNA-binding domain-containing protein [Candidatus Liptonbacteria bacterium]|nr:type IV secretion system DNA-binding domain-containing protein [Candidatus Liptonbacteria bacterium]
MTPTKDVIYFGRTDFRNTNRLFGVKRRDRRQHMYVVGKTGCGKTALLHNMVVQDITNGEGLCVIDPHGEFAESLLTKIPEERVHDIVYFNPADADYHLGFNPLEMTDPKHKHLVASGLMAIFTKIWANVWSARMEYIMNNAILALLDTPGSTLLGVTRILVDKSYRERIIANVKDPVVRAFWINEYESWRDQFRNEAIAPIQNKVGQFLSTALIRNVVGQPRSTIDLFDIMNSGKILLVNVSKGRIGEDNSALLGAMLITKIQLTAMERVRIPEDERRDFYLYVDEFQNFATDSFAGILSEARKYRLNLIIAHQYIGQLVTDVSTRVRDAVFGNVGTMLVFRVGSTDAEYLENEFAPELTIQDMVNLPNYCVYLKLMVDGVTSRPFSAATLPPFNVPASAATAEHIIGESRKLYAVPREEIEEHINRWAGSLGETGSEMGVSSRGVGRAPRTAAPAAPGVRYSAVCSSCGKTTELNFSPTEGRPVYCRECLAKIKSGELPRVRMERPKTAKPQEKYLANLAALGIEYESSPPGRNEEREKPSAAPVPSRGREMPQRRTAPEADTLSLKDLKPFEKMPKEKHSAAEVDIEKLREAIHAALETQEAGEPAQHDVHETPRKT